MNHGDESEPELLLEVNSRERPEVLLQLLLERRAVHEVCVLPAPDRDVEIAEEWETGKIYLRMDQA